MPSADGLPYSSVEMVSEASRKAGFENISVVFGDWGRNGSWHPSIAHAFTLQSDSV